MAQLLEVQNKRNLTLSKIVNQHEINDVYKKFHGVYVGNKDHYFALQYLCKKFNISEEEAAAFIAFDTEAYGIDSYYHEKVKGVLQLFKFTWTSDHMSFKDSMEKFAKVGIDKLFLDEFKNENESGPISRLKNCLSENRGTISKIVVNFVFNGDPVNAEQSKVLGFLREGIEDKKILVDNYFSLAYDNSQCDLVIQYVSNDRVLGHLASTRKGAIYSLGFDQSLKISNKENELTIAFVPLGNLYEMYSDLGDRFFQKNIRSGLDDGNMTNYEIKKSLKRILSGEESPEKFALYHNGISLTAQTLEPNGESFNIVEPRILNGAQTVKILKQFVESNSNNEQRIQELLRSTKVMARIIRSTDDDFLKKVTINNNRQNPIMPWNLRANDMIQLGFEEFFGKLGIYYERRENAFKNLTDEDLEAIGAESGVIEIRKFAQTLMAMQGQVDRISEIREIFENDIWYHEIFKNNYLGRDSRIFVLLYKLQYRLPSIIREIKSLGTEKYAYVTKGKNLVWCLGIQGLLNDDKLNNHVDRYGTSPAMEAGLTKLLKTIASTRLRIILKETFVERKYREDIEQGRFSFLKTKATLNDCMQTASKYFGWEKKSL